MNRAKSLIAKCGLTLLLTLSIGTPVPVEAQPATSADIAQLNTLKAKMQAEMADLQTQRAALVQNYKATLKTPGNHRQAQEDFQAQMRTLREKMDVIQHEYRKQRQSLLHRGAKPGSAPTQVPR